jgi:cobalt-zinc-cadmium efflux system outer membrane protein
MRSRLLRSLWSLPAFATCFACATVDPQPDYDRAREEIRAATGAQDVFDPSRAALTNAEIDVLLRDGLGLEEATRLALLNNRRLQAGFFAIGVSRADFVQAGLLANPSLSLAFLFPDTGGRVKWTADLMGNVADVWQLPARQDVARAGLEQRILEISRFAGELVAGTQAAYFESSAAREARAVALANVELARRSLAGVRAQVEGGVATRTDEALAESSALSADLEHQRSERDVAAALRRLAALLSVERDLLDVALTDPLPGPTHTALAREALVERTLAERADVRAADRAVSAAEKRVALERRSRFGLDAGVSAERPEGGASNDFLLGPAAGIELPLFDQHQAQIARAQLELAERVKEREALAVEVRQQVRAAFDAADVASRAAAFANGTLVPQALQTEKLAERAYALGDTTVLTLLQAQKAALDARRTGIDALLEAALARIELERAAGARLEDGRP